MNKKVLIDKQALIDKLMKIPGVGSNSDALKTIKRFPSYEPQKVKVPAFVAEYIIWCHSEGLTLWKVFKGIRGMPEKVWKWLKDEDHQAVFSKAYTDGYEVEEEPQWVANEGDLVVRRGEHEAKVYFVESIHEDGILLVNGIKDEFFTDLDERSAGEESINYFYENFRLLAKKESLEVEKV